MDSLREYPLFWLQYAIACNVNGNFEQTKQYFKTAYSYADAWREKFDTYQIDTYYAEFLIERAIEDSYETADAVQNLKEAHKLLMKTTDREKRIDHVYKVAKRYLTFYFRYAKSLTTNDRSFIENAASSIIGAIHRRSESRRVRAMRDCETDLTVLLEKISKVDF